MASLVEMFLELEKAPVEFLPSKYWQQLNKKNLRQLDEEGFKNFKRTLALNYFTFLVGRKDAQLAFLKKNLNWNHFFKAGCRIISSSKHENFTRKQSIKYNVLTHLLWEYAQKIDWKGILKNLNEPELGNPPTVYAKGRLISQDLANSVLEYYSMMDALDEKKIHSILELGAGYGRTAYIFLKQLAKIKCFIVDIPPALYISQSYLSSLFPEKKIFYFRPFKCYSEVADEINSSDIIFLLPHQMQSLPSKSIDLFYNISSLHEMRKDQIANYFREIERLTTQFFYFKQWKLSKIPYDEEVIKENDYPIPFHWKKIYHRDCRVQSYFFEALYQTDL